jgi:hypothetical protein
MVVYPSEEWLHEYCRALNASEDLQDFGFSENLLLVLTDFRLDELCIRDLNQDLLDEIPESVREDLADMTISEAIDAIDGEVRESLPEPVRKMVAQADRYVFDGTVFVYIELDNGSCFGPALVDDLSALEYDSIFMAPAATWQAIVKGQPAVSAYLTGEMEIIGPDLLKLKHLAELQLLCDIATEDIETEFLFPHDKRNFIEFMFDESLRHPIAIQKRLTREAALAFRTLTPF